MLLFASGRAERLGTEPDGPRQPGPAPQHRRFAEEQKNRACEGCHRTIAEEWRASFHRQSYTDSAVQESLRGEREPFCRSCHAPEADPRTPPTGFGAEAGVACVTCHRPQGALLAGSTSPASNSPHRDVQAFASGEGPCVRCHEFQFPDGVARSRPEWMQRTASEHRESPYPERSCIDCHMPRTGSDGHRSHRFTAGHDPDTLRRVLSVQTWIEGGGPGRPASLWLRLIPRGVGHAFPTGDLLRRLLVSIERPESKEPARSLVEVPLSRRFVLTQQVRGRAVLVERADERISRPTELCIPLPVEGEAQPLRWRVRYQRVVALHGGPGGGARIDGEVVLAEGTVTVDVRPPP